MRPTNFTSAPIAFGFGTSAVTTSSSNAPGTSSAWSLSGAKLAQFHGVGRDKFALHLKETEFRFNHRNLDLYKALLIQKRVFLRRLFLLRACSKFLEDDRQENKVGELQAGIEQQLAVLSQSPVLVQPDKAAFHKFGHHFKGVQQALLAMSAVTRSPTMPVRSARRDLPHKRYRTAGFVSASIRICSALGPVAHPCDRSHWLL